MSQQRVLVTGAASPLGQAVGRRLKSESHYGIGTIRTQNSINDLSTFDHLLHLDLKNLATINSLDVEFDSIVHIAALSVGAPLELMQVTGIATTWLADMALRRGTRNFIHVSSMSVYGQVNVSTVSSSTEIRHTTPYGAAKWASECYLNSLSSRLPAVSIRSCGIVGRKSHRNFLAEVLVALTEQQPRIYASNPDFLFNNVIHEDTLAAFMVKLALNHQSGFNAVPVGSLDPMPFRTVLEMMADRTNFRGVVEWIPPKSQPFSIDITDAVKMGLRPLKTRDTINKWLDDALGEVPRR
jgi:nucleoside-diphosphate-sugar epimerase